MCVLVFVCVCVCMYVIFIIIDLKFVRKVILMFFFRFLDFMLVSLDQPVVRSLRVLRPLKLVNGIESKSLARWGY